MKNKHLHIILFAVLVAFLFLPLAQKSFLKIKVKPLYGVFEKTMKPSLTLESYSSGHYQANIEQYISENYGFREPTIRLYNQYLWDFYRKTYVKYVVVGKDDWLYFEQNANDYYGTEMYRWFDSTEEARTTFERKARILYKLHGVLKDYGIDFMVFVAPEKGFLYSEYLPERQFDTTSINATKFYTEKFKEYNIPFIEMTEWYEKIKDTTSFPLFSQYGDHWNFSCVYGADSLFRFMGDLKGIKLPEITTGARHKYSKEDYKTHFIDFDIEQTLNLIFPLNHKKNELLIADVNVSADSSTIKPRALFVGNSFLWRIRDLIPLNEVFRDPMLWYYNSTAYFGQDLMQSTPLSNLSTIQEILKSDYIVFFTNGSQMYKLSYGFAEKALLDLCVPNEIMNREIQRISDSLGISKNQAKNMIINNPELIPELRGDSIPVIRNEMVTIKASTAIKMIENDAAWENILKKHAAYRGKSLSFIKNLEAENIIKNRVLLKDINPDDGKIMYENAVNNLINKWKNDPEYSRVIKEKALKNKKNIEEMYHLDAVWVIDNYPDTYYNLIYNNIDSIDDDTRIENIKKNIMSDDNWLESIKAKAEKNGITLEEQIERDARWMLNHN